MTRILIAEDEALVASFLEKGLQANGYGTDVAADGKQALELACSGRFDLVILDLGLPGKHGYEVLSEIRARDSRLPVVILSARGSVGDTVDGLERGADDYIGKPFRFDELLARVRARLRSDRAVEQDVLRAGEAALDLKTRQAIVTGRTIALTGREFALAEVFFRRPGEVLSREELLSEVWGDAGMGSNVVDVHIGYLRRKLGARRIASVRGEGYRLDA